MLLLVQSRFWVWTDSTKNPLLFRGHSRGMPGTLCVWERERSVLYHCNSSHGFSSYSSWFFLLDLRFLGVLYSLPSSSITILWHFARQVSKINEALSDSHSALSAIKCPSESCGQKIFKGLCRKRRRKIAVVKESVCKGISFLLFY